MRTLVISIMSAISAGFAFAKLPPPSPEQAARAAEAAARTAWQNSVDNFKLCLAQDRVAQQYRARTGKPALSTELNPLPACTDPGSFTPPPTESKPLEAAGAHSPPPTAASPPNTKTPDAELKPAPKR